MSVQANSDMNEHISIGVFVCLFSVAVKDHRFFPRNDGCQYGASVM